jgi:ABC-2 type transport system permease protein
MSMGSFLRTTWAIMRKDVGVWRRRRANVATTFLPPLVFLLVQVLGAAAVGRSPVALVVQDAGPRGAQLADAIRRADVFRVREVDAAQANALLEGLEVVAVVTIPSDLSARVAACEQAPIDVTVNNLNLDFTNDIRRAVPDAITQYYQAQGDASPVKVTMREHDLRTRDVELYQYGVLPIITLLLLIAGLISSGLGAALEWESRTIKELLLAPVPAAAIVAGKVLAGFSISFVMGSAVLILTALLGWVEPRGVYWLTALLIIALVALLGSGLGVAVGALLRRVSATIAVSINASLYLFFLAGGISVLAFEPVWLQNVAAFVPLTYGIHGLQMALFYNSADLLARDVLILAVCALAAVTVGTWALRRRLAR